MQLSNLLFISLLHLSIVYADLRKHATAHYSQNGTIYIIGGITTNNEFASPLLTFDFKSSDLSLQPSSSNEHLQPSIGHTSHMINNTLFTVFGLHPQTNHTQLNKGPTPRYHHTSILIDDQLYLFGGLSTQTNQLLSDAWLYSLSNQTWSPITPYNSGFGHISFTYQHWIISCLGQSDHCTWFDTKSHHTTLVQAPGPGARVFATLTSLHNNRYILFGGERKNETLGDLWQLNINAPFEMQWVKLASGPCRSGHVGVFIDPLMVYYGGQDEVSPSLYFNVTSRQWIDPPKSHLMLIQRLQAKMDKGVIGGLVVGVFVFVFVLVLTAVWLWRRKGRAQVSRASRFSAHMNHEPSSEKIQVDSMVFDVKAEPFMSLPELAAHTRDTRLSTISLGAAFKFSAEDYDNKEYHVEEKQIKNKTSNNSLNGLKRLTQHLFSHHEQDPERSGDTRASIGTKSVASVQWVGFNDTMDYKGWRGGSNSSLHLAVKNAGRSSVYTNDSAQSTPRSPMFPHHLRDSVIVHYPQEDVIKQIVEKRFVNA